jgi:hypothetical protein
MKISHVGKHQLVDFYEDDFRLIFLKQRKLKINVLKLM